MEREEEEEGALAACTLLGVEAALQCCVLFIFPLIALCPVRGHTLRSLTSVTEGALAVSRLETRPLCKLQTRCFNSPIDCTVGKYEFPLPIMSLFS